MNKIIISHVADLQVKNRENNLYEPYDNSLENIISIVSNNNSDILVISGDLFEYCEPNDSERKLIYRFLSRVSSLDSLKEIVLLAGNHDLPKFKKHQIKSDVLDENIIAKENPINLFLEIINNLSEENKNKFIYINESRIYHSKISDKIDYIGYSLEDNMNINLEGYDKDKINICLFHAMIKEYVDESNIPLRKDILDSLKDLSFFPENSIILAGDIHESHTYCSNNRTFIYPGSTQQHTHNEGDFMNVIDVDKIECKNGEKKKVNHYIIDTNDSTIEKNGISFIDDYVRYITLNASSKITAEENIVEIKKLCEQIVSGINQTYVKIKAPNSLTKYERDIFDYVKKCSPNAIVSFNYDKIVNQVTEVSNEIVREIISEVVDSGKTNEDSFDFSDIDSLVLNNEQLSRMFESVVVSQLEKTSIDYSLSPDIKSDLMNLFKQQLETVTGKGRRYSVKLKSILCNQFMALGKNKINLDEDGGIVRILGTNGIGKTTLFNMIRWIITGMVYEGMKSNRMVQNNLVIFHKDHPENDVVKVVLNLTNNDVPVKIIRTVHRKWKNNTTDEQKISKNWKDFAKTESELEIIIRPGEPNEKKIIGDNAQANINAWFGDVIKTIMFINSMSIDKMLKSDSVSLNDMILSFIGVDYLQSLENNLEIVKDDLYSIGKPSRTISEINNERDLSKKQLSELDELSKENDSKLSQYKRDKDVISEEKENNSNKMISLGDIPSLISSKTNERKNLFEKISGFVERERKEKLVWKETKPEIDNELISSKNRLIDDYQKDIESIKEKDINIEQESSELHKYVLSFFDEKISDFEKDINDIKDSINNRHNLFSMILGNDICRVIDETISKISELISVKDSEISSTKNELNSLKSRILEIDNTIKSGICEKCGRPFDEHFEDIKVKLSAEKDEKLSQISELEKSIIELSEKKTTYISKKDEYNNLRKYVVSSIGISSDIKNVNEFCEYMMTKKISNKYQEFIENIREISLYIKTKSEELFSKESSKKKISEIKNNLLVADIDYIDEEVKDKIERIKEFRKCIADDEKIITEKYKEIESLKNDIDSIKTDFSDKLSEYQSKYEKFVKDNDDIEKYNREIDDEKNKNMEDKIALSNIDTELSSLESKLPEWQELSDKNNDLISQYKKIDVEIEECISIEKSYISKKSDLSAKIENCEKEYEKSLLYFKNDIIYKIYSKIIKNSFKDIVFEYYRTFLNNTLDSLLQDVNFKLFWDSNSQLMMVTVNNGNTSYIHVNQASGMETIFAGLSLIYTISLLNIKHTCSHIFIDELSGQLSSGKNLQGNVKNYQELFVKIISKFSEKTIFIVDHNIENINESRVYEVIWGNEGNKYIES